MAIPETSSFLQKPSWARSLLWHSVTGVTRKTEGAPTTTGQGSTHVRHTSHPAGMWAPPGQEPALAHPWVPRAELGSELTAQRGH